MSLKECYDKMGADYEDVLSRLRSEVLVRKFALKFLDDDSYANLKAAMESGNAPEAFRGAHTLKGVAQNLGFGPLYKAAAEVTESLRPSETSSGDMEKAAKLMPAVDEEYARTIAAIKELLVVQFTGSFTVNLDPRSGWLVTSMVPSQRLRIFFTNVSPRPLPSMLRLPSAW